MFVVSQILVFLTAWSLDKEKNVTKPPFIFELVQIQIIFGATTVGTKLNLEYFNIGTQGTLKTAKFN